MSPRRSQFREPLPRLLARLAAAAGCATMPCAALAANLTVAVEGLRSTEGEILVAVCTEEAFLTPDCAHSGQAPAEAGEVAVAGVPPGTYAVQAFHDENGNGVLDRDGLRPVEGLAFSRDARMRFGPPRFGDAAVRIGPAGGRVVLTMRYYR